jgi:hypothetical protein
VEGAEGAGGEGHAVVRHLDAIPEGIGVGLDAEGGELGGRGLLGDAGGEGGDGEDGVVGIGTTVEGEVEGGAEGLVAEGEEGVVGVGAEDGADGLQGAFGAGVALEEVDP